MDGATPIPDPRPVRRSAQMNRLPAGGGIDRSRPLDFRFDGRDYQGYAGDTLASALLANGVGLVGRSYKYGRPRGIVSAGPEEPGALVTLGSGAALEPNIRPTMVALRPGLEAFAQPSPAGTGPDPLAWIADRFSRFLPPGFYYKTFSWPRRLWPFYERMLRSAASAAPVPEQRDEDRYEQRYLHCDVLVVGGGPAGLAAALAAGRAGASVVLADENAELGGALADEPDTPTARAWVATMVRELDGLPEVETLRRTSVVAFHDHNYLIAVEERGDAAGTPPAQRLLKIRAREVVLATGAVERPLVFPDNDRPGVMLAGAVRTYLNRYAVMPGRTMVVFTNNDTAYRTALEAVAAGARVTVVDIRRQPRGALVRRARAAGIAVLCGHSVTAVRGRRAVRGVEVRALTDDGDGMCTGVGGGAIELPCTVVATSGGWIPAVQLFSQSGGRLRFRPDIGAHVPAEPSALNRSRPAGACNGSFTLAACVADGVAAGRAAAGAEDGAGIPHPPLPGGEEEEAAFFLPHVPERLPGRLPSKSFVDLQSDVTVADIGLAEQEGYGAVEHLKRYTALGMGPDQGRTSGLNGLAVLAARRGVGIEALGHTTFRPNTKPVRFGAIAGPHLGPSFTPQRRTPMQPWHEASGAVFEDTGSWIRPFCFPHPGETAEQAVRREARAARIGVGLLDASTLGKIEVQGSDAEEFLDRMYVTTRRGLAIGRCRYGMMLNENGVVFDDGVTTRLAPDHFLLSTNSSGAARVLRWLEEWLQTEWPDLDVFCTCVTEQWANATLVGPLTRDLLCGMTDIDLDPARFPFMSMRQGTVAGFPARVFRIAYSGDLSFEINVPARHGLALWENLVRAGETFGLTPYGTEAMHLLRAEKGFIVVGQDTDGTVTPVDLGQRVPADTARDFVGKRSLFRADMLRDDRKQLVGLLTADPGLVLPVGTHLTDAVRLVPPVPTLGFVTTGHFSPAVGRSIALALVVGGRDRLGETVTAYRRDGGPHPVTIVPPCFYDPAGERRHA
jgi:sarcosine oxidase, subunit alpha